MKCTPLCISLNTFCFFSVRQDLEEDGYYGEEGGEEEYEDGEPYAKAANMELSLGTLQLYGMRPMLQCTAVRIYPEMKSDIWNMVNYHVVRL